VARVRNHSPAWLAKFESETAKHLQTLAVDGNWDLVDASTSLGKPDLILRTPDGSTVVVDIKAGSGFIHPTTVALADRARDLVKDVLDTKRKSIDTLVVTTLDSDTSTNQLAKDLGVGIIKTSSSIPEVVAQEAFATLSQWVAKR
jgi:hypothetical protein